MFHVKQQPEGGPNPDGTEADEAGHDSNRDRGATGEAGAVAPAADAMRIGATGAASAVLVVYREQLDRFRRTLDLMSDRGFAELDVKLAEAERYAAAIARHATTAGAVLDLGTGAGFPGVVVAARLTPRRVWWVERRRRRAAFLDQLAAHAGLREVRVAAEDVRALDVGRTGRVAGVTAQAVASLGQVAALTRHLWSEDVVLVSRKGPGWEAEVDALRGAAEGWGADGGSATVEVVATEPLGSGGTLVAVRVLGGSECPPSA